MDRASLKEKWFSAYRVRSGLATPDDRLYFAFVPRLTADGFVQCEFREIVEVDDAWDVAVIRSLWTSVPLRHEGHPFRDINPSDVNTACVVMPGVA